MVKSVRIIHLTIFALLFLFVLQGRSLAANRYVAPTIADCNAVCDSVSDDPCLCYTNIQTAIDNSDAGTGDIIIVYPGDYVGNFVLNKAVSISGTETAQVRFYAQGSSPALTINSTGSSVGIKRITFMTGGTGIRVVNAMSSVEIKNNIFRLGSSGTGVIVQSSPSTRIINNTFYGNATAISRDSASIEIVNNIFSLNSTNISQAGLTDESNISYNCFHPAASEPNGSYYIPDQDHPDPDPKFVNPDNGDFHLQTGSPCIDTGSPSISDPSFYPDVRSDMGAYGGPDTDTIPFPVSDLSVISKTDNSVTVSWGLNRCYLTAGYKVYYDSDRSGPPYEGADSDDGAGNALPSPIDAGNVTQYTIANLDPSVTKPAAPTGLASEPLNSSLRLFWNPVSGATGYNVYAEPGDCASSCTEPSTKAASVSTNSITLYGLENPDPDPHCYCIAVSAYAQTTYYIAVRPYYSDSSTEAVQYSNEVSVGVGSMLESDKSAVIRDYPEPIVANPDLPSTGCFIATAAYGYYSSEEVQALRLFRDRYLMTNSFGRAFVAWYYLVSPKIAAHINSHPGLKPLVRAGLMPVVWAAMFMTTTTPLIRLGAFGIIALLFVFLMKAWRRGQRP